MPNVDDYKGAPRWVKISAIITVILALLLISHFYFGGDMAGMHGSAMGR
ncbi:MAG: hypothetical protein M3O03_13400 [Pseudomonadota bacterium]|nr:hypothetical protein [Pseudomonadota bacterium]